MQSRLASLKETAKADLARDESGWTGGKIAFMKRLAGVGDKYVRKIWMDVYHPDFFDHLS